MADKSEKNLVKKTDKPSAAKKAKKPNLFKRIGKWFRDIINEIKKITWPTMRQTLKNTLIVIVMVLVVGAYIWILDLLLSYGISLLRSLVA